MIDDDCSIFIKISCRFDRGNRDPSINIIPARSEPQKALSLFLFLPAIPDPWQPLMSRDNQATRAGERYQYTCTDFLTMLGVLTQGYRLDHQNSVAF
jgi:hypothetical protein